MGKVIRIEKTIIAHHLVLSGYGHWLPNDPRGSGSSEIREDKLDGLGPVHFGRKRKQPSRKELKDFYAQAEGLLSFETIWFDDRAREVITDALARVSKEFGYTVWACAVLQDHGHLVNRVHRDSGELMWERYVVASRDALREAGLVPPNHPVWANRPYVVYKTTVALVHGAVKYVHLPLASPHGCARLRQRLRCHVPGTESDVDRVVRPRLGFTRKQHGSAHADGRHPD